MISYQYTRKYETQDLTQVHRKVHDLIPWKYVTLYLTQVHPEAHDLIPEHIKICNTRSHTITPGTPVSS